VVDAQAPSAYGDGAMATRQPTQMNPRKARELRTELRLLRADLMMLDAELSRVGSHLSNLAFLFALRPRRRPWWR
jgi:hypothetical protein